MAAVARATPPWSRSSIPHHPTAATACDTRAGDTLPASDRRKQPEGRGIHCGTPPVPAMRTPGCACASLMLQLQTVWCQQTRLYHLQRHQGRQLKSLEMHTHTFGLEFVLFLTILRVLWPRETPRNGLTSGFSPELRYFLLKQEVWWVISVSMYVCMYASVCLSVCLSSYNSIINFQCAYLTILYFLTSKKYF